MMPTLKITASLVIFAMVGACHAQEASPLVPMEKAAVVAAQTSSTTNYSLLEPIANKPVRRNLGSAGLLEPISAVAVGQTAGDTAGASKIIVTPLTFKRGIFDEHEFKVHNASGQALREAKILLTAPVGSVVQQVSPKPDSVDGSSILVTVDQIAPGDHKIINVTINYPRNEFAKFESMVITESWGQNSYAGTEDALEAELSATPKMLQPASRGMLEPKEPEQSGMLKPRVPAIMASATTSRITENDHAQTTATTGDQNTVKKEIAVGSPSDDSAVKSYFHGPTEVVVGEVNDYQIDIQNLSSKTANGIIVQLSIPSDMKVTVLDRDAWYDAKNRKISWQLDQIDGRVLESIRYKAVVKKPCSTEQTVVVGLDSKVQSTSSLKTKAK